MTATVRRAGVELAKSQPPPYHQSEPAWELYPGTGEWDSHPTVQGTDALDHACRVEIAEDRLSGSIALAHDVRVLTFKFWVVFDAVDTYGPTNTSAQFGDWTATYQGEPCEFWIGDKRFRPEHDVQLSILEADDGRIEVVLPWAADRSDHTADADGYFDVSAGRYETAITRL